MVSLEITTLDIAEFFYNRDISLKRRSEIILNLWKKKNRYLEYYLYDNLRIFSDEINSLLLDLSLNNIISEEAQAIKKLQSELELKYATCGLYSLNNNKIEEFLKECKLRLMYDTDNQYIYMKMRTLVKSCGYKKRSQKFVNDLINSIWKLKLYISYKDTIIAIHNDSIDIKIMDVKMDAYVRIYSY